METKQRLQQRLQMFTEITDESPELKDAFADRIDALKFSIFRDEVTSFLINLKNNSQSPWIVLECDRLLALLK